MRIARYTIWTAALAVASGWSSAEVSRPVHYANLHMIASDDSPEVVVSKAARVLPRPNQSAWMRMERTFFLHYGPNSFRGVEWGDGREPPALFNPTALDAHQWMRAVKDAGGKLLILVAKHHDGLCLWPSRYTSHSVGASPWRAGRGDLVREVAEAARAQGIKLGIYLSPADLFQLRTNPNNPAGYYGNRSARRRSVIPTDPASFTNHPSRGREPAPGFSSYTYEVDDYNRYFLNQLYELLTGYGPISVAWFDGANPDPTVAQDYDYSAWYDLIRRLQPNAVISVKGPDVRWVGNESGHGRTTEWSVIPLPEPPDRHTWPDRQQTDLGSREQLKRGSYLWWYPAEVNTPILNGWFWSREKRAKSPAELVDYFYRSVGRNGTMLLNLSPDDRGLIPDDQLAALQKMARFVDETFSRNLAQGAALEADTSNPVHSPTHAQDGNLDTWWEPAPGRSTAEFTLRLPAPVTFDVISLQEAVDHRSQRIESFVVEVRDGSEWRAPESLEEQTTVGYKRLLRLMRPVLADQVRIRINASRLEPTLAEVGLYLQARPKEPKVSERDREGYVTLSHPHPRPIVYTVDGSEPHAGSSVYRSPVHLPRGGTIQAAVLTADETVGLVATKTIVGLAPTGWKVVTGPAEGPGEGGSGPNWAIDADAMTRWEEPVGADEAARPSLTIDLGRLERIRGFAYLPRHDWVFRGVVDRYRFETSADGRHWTTRVEAGEFGNIRNNPTLQEVTFSPVDARFFRFTPLRDVDQNGWVGAAEITVLPALP